MFSSPNIVRMVKSNMVGWEVYVCSMQEREEECILYNVLMRIPEGKTSVGKLSHILMNNIKIYVIERG